MQSCRLTALIGTLALASTLLAQTPQVRNLRPRQRRTPRHRPPPRDQRTGACAFESGCRAALPTLRSAAACWSSCRAMNPRENIWNPDSARRPSRSGSRHVTSPQPAGRSDRPRSEPDSLPRPILQGTLGRLLGDGLPRPRQQRSLQLFHSRDLVMKPVKLPRLIPATAGLVSLTLDQKIPEPPAAKAPPGTEPLDFVSPRSARSGAAKSICAGGWCFRPATPRATRRSGGVLDTWLRSALERPCSRSPKITDKTAAHHYPEMIWVVLDESLPSGTHEFADSVNNGPWAKR